MVEDCISLCFLVRLDDGYYCRWCSHIHCMNPTLARLTGVVAFQQSLIVMSCPLSPQVCSSIPFLSRFPWSLKTWWGPCWSEHYIREEPLRVHAPPSWIKDILKIYSSKILDISMLCYEVLGWRYCSIKLSPYCSFFQDSNPCLLCLCQCLMCPYNFKALSEG